MDFEKFLELVRALHAQQVRYVLVGGVAMGAHGLLPAMETIDLFVAADKANVLKLRAALKSVWDDPEIDQISADKLAGGYLTIRYGFPDGLCFIDILSSLGTALAFEDLEAEDLEMEGVPVRVATPRTLYRMKKDTLRPIDQADAAALQGAGSPLRRGNPYCCLGFWFTTNEAIRIEIAGIFGSPGL